MHRSSNNSGWRRHALASAVFLALVGGTAQAQVSTSTIKGLIASARRAGTTVTAVNLATGNILPHAPRWPTAATF